MYNKSKKALIWLATPFTRFWFWITHEHYMICTDKADLSLTGGEKYYWHIHKCENCGAKHSVLNATCKMWNRRVSRKK